MLVAMGTAAVIAAVIAAVAIHARIEMLDARARGRRQQLTAAMQGISEGLVMFDEERRAIVWNSLIEELAPRLKDVLRPGAKYESLFPRDDNPIARGGGDGTAADTVLHGERHLPDGRWIHVRETTTEGGYLVVSWTDITARKLAEQRMRSFLDNAPYAFVAVDAHGHIVLTNRAALEIFEYTEEELLGEHCRILVPSERRPQIVRLIAACLQGLGASAWDDDDELHAVRKNGEKFPVELTHSVLNFGRDSLVAFGISDITKRKQIEAQLRHSQKMEAVGQLTGGLAHDFNNLLTVVIGNLQLLEEGLPKDGSAQEQIQDALAAATRGSELTKRLLAFSRRQLLAPQSLDINRLVAELGPLVSKTVTPHVEIATKLAADLWLVEVDRSQLENALLNLAINARDAMSGGGKLTIETSNTSLDELYAARHPEVVPGDYVRLVVTDNGTGMTKEVLANAFQPFFSTKGAGRGSGLGLSMVYGFVKQSKGHIDIYSEPGYGTSVRIYLPRSDALAEDTTIVTITRPVIPSGQEKILLVDDDRPVRRAVALLLANLGYDVVEAGDGPEALAQLENGEPFDLLLTDIVMPGGMSGLDLAQRARKRRPDLKILLTSGYTDTAMLAQGILQPSDQILSKPYRKAELAEKVRSTLDQPARA
jgi:PAS domain S-box-containing protein